MRVTGLIILLAALVLLGWRYRKPVVAAVTPCPDAADLAVLDAVYGKIPKYNYLDIWMSDNYDEESWAPRLNTAQAEITRIREWSKQLPNPCVRAGYAHWMDYYQRELDSAWNELRFQSKRKEHQDYDRKQALKERSVEEYKQKNVVPTPPTLR